jgi:hypothetical protein
MPGIFRLTGLHKLHLDQIHQRGALLKPQAEWARLLKEIMLRRLLLIGHTSTTRAPLLQDKGKHNKPRLE